MKKIYLVLGFIVFTNIITAQNVGIGTTTPESKLHIKGTVDFSQFIIDAYSMQGNTNPLIKLRKSDGSDLMWIHSDDVSNVFIGVDAGKVNNASGGFGIVNTFLGNASGYSNTTGYENTATGYGSLNLNSSGYQNTANGKGALYSNTTGYKNSASGRNALFSNSTGRNNVAMGDAALLLSTTGSNNTAYGTSALFSNTASDNTATGYQVLYSNTTGSKNTASGNNALFSNTTGDENIACGNNALYSNTTGGANTASGYQALYSNTTGSLNTALGRETLYSNTIGDANTAIGHWALYSNVGGTFNTAVGETSLANLTGGSENTALGYLTGPIAGTLSNTTCIGSNAHATASNQMVLGNTSVTEFYCFGAFAGTTASAPNLTVLSTGQIVRSTSSRRYKKDILPLEINTSNIYQLRPVSYNSYTDDIRHFGLIAEEVADVIPELASYSREKDVIKGSTNDKLIPDAVQYPLLSVLLLSEVQKHEQTINELKTTITEMKKSEAQVQVGKQQTIIEKQQQQIEALQNDIKELKAMMQSKK